MIRLSREKDLAPFFHLLFFFLFGQVRTLFHFACLYRKAWKQLLYDWLADLLKSLTRYSNVRDCLRRPKLTPKGTPDDGYEGLLTYQFVLLKYDGGQNLFSLQTAQYAYVKMSHHIYFTQSRQKKAKNLRKGS